MTDLEKLCETAGVTIVNKYGAPVNDNFRDANGWTCTLRYQGRRLTVPFYQGTAITHEPTAADVLYCLCSDATSVENASSFEDWCADFGYDTDSRSAERIYKACERIAAKLRRLLGDDFDKFAGAEH